MTELEQLRDQTRAALRTCRDPQRNAALQKELTKTMEAIAASREPYTPDEEIAELRQAGDNNRADALQRAADIQAARERLERAQNPDPHSLQSMAARELKAAQEALEEAQAPTTGQSSRFERRKLFDEANEMRAQAALLSRSPIAEERARGQAMGEQVKEKLEEWESFRVTH